jgi:DhnA family fructose-bisphosphate aldolase class Ia
MRDEDRKQLSDTRFARPEAVAEAAKKRRKRSSLGDSGRLLIIAADHTARGIIEVAPDSTAMGNRYELLDRLCTALSIPGVDGVLGTPDIIEDLLLLGALDDKVVFGSMNRGGLPGAVFELDDRFTGYTPDSIVSSGLDGGKMLLRINPDDPGTVNTIVACADAVTRLALARRVAMLEPFMNKRTDGLVRNILTADAVVRSMAIASALGATSAYTWLKVPVVDNMNRVAEAATLPIVLLGGERSKNPDEMFRRWEAALRLPGVRGLVVGRNLLFPADDDVATAVKTAVSLL